MERHFALCESQEDEWQLVCCTDKGGLQTLLYGSHPDVHRCDKTEPVQLSEGSALTIMKGASGVFQKRRIWHVIVQPKVRSSRVASVVRFINIRLASRAHQ